jgi:hypothetical protein
VRRKVGKTHCSLVNSDVKLCDNRCGVRSILPSRAIKAIMEGRCIERNVTEVRLASSNHAAALVGGSLRDFAPRPLSVRRARAWLTGDGVFGDV